MGKRAAVQGQPFALEHAYTASMLVCITKQERSVNLLKNNSHESRPEKSLLIVTSSNDLSKRGS